MLVFGATHVKNNIQVNFYLESQSMMNAIGNYNVMQTHNLNMLNGFSITMLDEYIFKIIINNMIII